MNTKLTKRQQVVLSGRFNQIETARKSLYHPGLWATAAGYTSAALLYRLADLGLIGFGVEGGGSVDCHYAAPTAEGERIRELTQGTPLSRRQQELLLAMYWVSHIRLPEDGHLFKYHSRAEWFIPLYHSRAEWFITFGEDYNASTVYALCHLGLVDFLDDTACLTPDGEELAALLSQVR